MEELDVTIHLDLSLQLHREVLVGLAMLLQDKADEEDEVPYFPGAGTPDKPCVCNSDDTRCLEN